MRLALIGDIHVYAQRVGLRQYLLSRRIVGHTNSVLTRRSKFDHGLLEPLLEKVQAVAPDMALFSGDVTTTSLTDEFEDVARFVKPLSDHMPVVLVPGNHDRYTFGARRARRIETLMAGLIPDAFPDLRDLGGPWKLLSLDSAAPRIVSSSGELGHRQFEAVAAQVAGLTADQGVVVLCHYPVVEPPLTPRHRSHDLKERDALRQMLEACPARVVFLHGHIHKPWALLPGPPKQAPFISINAGAPCLTSDKYPHGQGFWQIDLPQKNLHDPVRLEHHVPRAVAGKTAIDWQACRVV